MDDCVNLGIVCFSGEFLFTSTRASNSELSVQSKDMIKRLAKTKILTHCNYLHSTEMNHFDWMLHATWYIFN